MMKEKKFFKNMPYPFSPQEEMRLKKKILSSLPEKNYSFIPKLIFASLAVLLIILIPFLNPQKDEEIKITKKIEVINPLKIKSEEIVLNIFSILIPDFKKEKVEDIPFNITKQDNSVKLEWQASGALKYRIKKCAFPPKDDCNYVGETNKNYYVDNEKEKEKLVVYIVEAVKS